MRSTQPVLFFPTVCRLLLSLFIFAIFLLQRFSLYFYSSRMGQFRRVFFSSPVDIHRGEVGECRRATRRTLRLMLSSLWLAVKLLAVLVLRPNRTILDACLFCWESLRLVIQRCRRISSRSSIIHCCGIRTTFGLVYLKSHPRNIPWRREPSPR